MLADEQKDKQHIKHYYLSKSLTKEWPNKLLSTQDGQTIQMGIMSYISVGFPPKNGLSSTASNSHATN